MNFVKKTVLLPFFFFVIVGFAQQYDPPLRLELPCPDGFLIYDMMPVGEQGMIVLRDNQDKQSWTLLQYDTLLTRVVEKKIPFQQDLSIQQSFASKTQYCAALQQQDSKASATNAFLVSYDIVEKKINAFAIKIPEKEIITDVYQFGISIVLVTSNNKSEQQTYLFNTETSTLQKFFQDENSRNFYFALVEEDKLILGTGIFRDKGEGALVLTVLDSLGQIINEKEIIINADYYVNDCSISKTSNNQYLIVGPYLNKGKRSLVWSRNASNGMMSLPLNENLSPQEAHFSDYSTIKTFDVLKMTTSGNLQNQTYFIAADDSITVYITEFFTLEYEQDMPISAGLSMVPYSTYSTSSRFVGYKFVYASIFSFDQKGKLLSCKMFDFSNLTTKTFRQILHGYLDEDHNLLSFFTVGSNYYFLISNLLEVEQPIKAEKVALSNSSDKVNQSYVSKISHWYNNSFLYFGYQQIKKRNMTKKSENTVVFFANKLIFD